MNNYKSEATSSKFKVEEIPIKHVNKIQSSSERPSEIFVELTFSKAASSGLKTDDFTGCGINSC